MSPPTVRASELANYAFCQRAWHYARSGVPRESHEHLQQGSAWHDQMERRSRQAILLLRSGFVLIVCGITLALFSLLIH